MQHELYSVKDVKAEVFTPPVMSHNLGTMCRSLMVALGDPGHQFARYPEDFVLFHLGTFDDANGHIVLMDTPVSVMSLVDLMEQEHGS